MKVYRSVSRSEFAKLMLGIPITGKWSGYGHSECAYSGYFGNVVCAFYDQIQWQDSDHTIFLELDIPENRIIETGISVWKMPKSFAKTKVYRGRTGTEEYRLEEVFFKEYDLRDASRIIEIPSPEYGLSEIYRYFYVSCPHYDRKMSREELAREYEKYTELFPENGTAIPKTEYKNSFLRLMTQIIEMKGKNKNG